MDDASVYSRVTYVAEQIGAIERLTNNDDIDDLIQERMEQNIREFAISGGHVLVAGREWKYYVETKIRMAKKRVLIGTYWFFREEPVIEHWLHIRAWAWQNVRPEHRDKLALWKVPDSWNTIDMLSADCSWLTL